jgi:Flp pilus assembly protein TadG
MKANAKMQTSAARRRRSCISQGAGILRSQSGQSLVEVALLTPLLLFLLIGGIELGRFAYIAILVGNAARSGDAYGAQSLIQSVDTTGIQAAAVNDFQDNGQDSTIKGKTVSNLTVTSATSCGCDNDGTITSALCTTLANDTAGTCTSGHWVVMLSVTASGTYNSLFNFPGIPSSIAISRTSTMRVAQY